MNTAEAKAEAACVNGGTELHLAARLGDVSRAAYLIEECNAQVNAYDQWQSTPLFYASLCGHVAVLRLLLKAGARCERGTFDGERVLYAALNDKVRNILLSEGFSFAASRGHDAFLDALENAYDERESTHARYRDLCIVIEDECDAAPAPALEAHMCVLAARCPYLACRFRGKRTVQLRRPRFSAAALASVLRWCYTVRLDVHRDDLLPTVKLLEQCGLMELAERLLTEAKLQPKQQQRLVVEPSSTAVAKTEMMAAMRQIYDACCDHTCGVDDDTRTLLRTGAIRFLVDGRVFHVHPAFLAPRSEFFDALCSRWRGNDSDDACVTEQEPVALNDVSHAAFSCLLHWAFTDSLDEETQRSPDNLIELLLLADRWLLDGLKQRCATVLVPHVDKSTCVPLLRLAERYDVDRLGAAAAATVAEHLLTLADDQELADAVRESAGLIKGRQVTDSIPVVDDIAFEVARLHGQGAEDGLSDEDEEERWKMPPDADAHTRESVTAAMRVEAKSCRRRKVAVLTQLAARVQGWDVVAVRTRR